MDRRGVKQQLSGEAKRTASYEGMVGLDFSADSCMSEVENRTELSSAGHQARSWRMRGG